MTALKREIALPSEVRGPGESWALRRLASSFRSETFFGTPKRPPCRGCCVLGGYSCTPPPSGNAGG
jgi:hypothetical protein